MGCHLLEVLIPAVISAFLFWEGVRCSAPGYSLNVSSLVHVQEGLCVTIPCTFTYNPSHAKPGTRLFGYWYTNPGKHLMATNDPKKFHEIIAEGSRFEVSEAKLNQSDCSLTIRQAKESDSKYSYYFRVERDPHAKYDYLQEGTVSLNVTERKPDMTVSRPLKAGHKASIVCSAQWCPSSGRPTVTLTGFSEDSTKDRISKETDTRVESRVDFILSAADHRRNITCKAMYEGRSDDIADVTAERTVTLDVSYAPRMIWFNGFLSNESRHEFRNETGIVAQEGDSLRVFCEAESNPVGNATWVEKPPFSGARVPTTQNRLLISNLKLQDKGKYTCQAENQEGHTKGVFYLQIPHGPTHCNVVDSICRREDGGYKCNCSICSYPSSQIEWKINEKVYKGNISRQEFKISSWNRAEEEAFSVLHLLGEWKENTSVICRGENPKGQLSIKYQLLDNKRSLNLVSGVIGALIMFGVILLLVTVAMTCRKFSHKFVPSAAGREKNP